MKNDRIDKRNRKFSTADFKCKTFKNKKTGPRKSIQILRLKF